MRFSGERIRTAFRVVMWSTPHPCLLWQPLWLCREMWMWPANLVGPYGDCRSRVLNLMPWGSFAVVSSCLRVEVEVKGKVNSEESSLCLSLALETLSKCAIEHVHVSYTDGKLWVRKTSLCSEKNEFYYGITIANFLLLLTF